METKSQSNQVQQASEGYRMLALRTTARNERHDTTRSTHTHVVKGHWVAKLVVGLAHECVIALQARE
jgi:hypothetical protein